MNHKYTIRNAQAELTVSTNGGSICSYRLCDGFDILRSQQNPLMTSCYPLLPYSNRIEGGLLKFDGNRHQLPLNFGDHPHSIHGVGWQSQWTVVSHSDGELELELDYEGNGWPFSFLARQKLSLQGSALRLEIEITNKASKPAPVGLGMHPYFPRHGDAVLTANVDAVWLNDETCLPQTRVKVPDRWDLKQSKNVALLECDNLFEPWTEPATIHWPQKGKSVALTASKELDRLVVYAPKGKDYFCVEPVSHITNAFNRSDEGMPHCESGMRILKKDESLLVWMQLDPL